MVEAAVDHRHGAVGQPAPVDGLGHGQGHGSEREVRLPGGSSSSNNNNNNDDNNNDNNNNNNTPPLGVCYLLQPRE